MSVVHAKSELCFGPFGLSSANGPLRSGDHVVALPRKALALLWALLGRAGEVVTKDELLSAAWPRAVVTEGVVAACLRDLRQALGDDPRRPRYIATAHGIGYRFIATVSHDAHAVRPQAAAAETAQADPVGREIELALLHDAFTRALGGQRQLVFVSGEAGIGKTTLVDTFMRQLTHTRDGTPRPAAHAGAVRVAHGQCSETFGAGEAYMPVLEAFDRLCRQPGGRAVTALLRRHAPTWLLQLPALLDDAEVAALRLKVASSAVERMLRELVEAVAAIAEREPLVLLFEDLHWCDRATVEWLSLLARRREATRLLVIGTCRPVELIVHQHPLKPVKQELVASGLAIDVPLGRLPSAAVQAYLERRLPGRAATLGAAVYRRSQGHPLFMVHLADDLERQPSAHAGDDPSPLPSDGPGGLRELIEAQLARLDPRQQLALEAASAAGAEFAAATVAAALQLAPEQAEALLDTLAAREQFIEDRGLAEWRDGTVSGRYAFRHDLYRETLYRRLGAARRARLHLRIGERLAQGYGDAAAEIAAELALHFAQAKDRRAARYCREAGETALRRHACRETLAHVEHGLSLLRSQPAGPESDRTELLLRLTQGAALLATRGFGATEVAVTYLRAQTLSLRLRDVHWCRRCRVCGTTT